MTVGLAARNFGKTPAEMLGVTDEVRALNFNLAVSFRLVAFDNKQKRDEARTIGAACAAAFAGEVLKFDGEDDNDD